MDGHIYHTFAECYYRRQFNTTMDMLGKYVNKQMKFTVDLTPVYKYLKEPTVPRPAEVRDVNGAFGVSVYVQRINQYCD